MGVLEFADAGPALKAVNEERDRGVLGPDDGTSTGQAEAEE